MNKEQKQRYSKVTKLSKKAYDTRLSKEKQREYYQKAMHELRIAYENRLSVGGL